MYKIIAGILFGVALCIVVLNRIGYFQKMNTATEKFEKELVKEFEEIFKD